MTDQAYRAKKWLNRTVELYEQAQKTNSTLLLIESRINSAVSSYENIGRGRTDPMVRQQQKEDALLDYSVKREQYEKEYMQFVRQEIISMKVLERLDNRFHAVILFDRHINRISINDMSKLKRYDMKKTQLYNHYQLALNELSILLDTEEPRAIHETDEYIRSYLQNETA